MTAQEKAQSLFDKMWVYTTSIDEDHDEEIKARAFFARSSAKVVCDEFILNLKNQHKIQSEFGEAELYWSEVKRIIGYINRQST